MWKLEEQLLAFRKLETGKMSTAETTLYFHLLMECVEKKAQGKWLEISTMYLLEKTGISSKETFTIARTLLDSFGMICVKKGTGRKHPEYLLPDLKKLNKKPKLSEKEKVYSKQPTLGRIIEPKDSPLGRIIEPKKAAEPSTIVHTNIVDTTNRNTNLASVCNTKNDTCASKDSITKNNNTKLDRLVEKKTMRKFIPPTMEQVKAYIDEKNLLVDAENFMEFFIAGDWHDSTGKPVKNWKQKILVWDKYEREKRENGRYKRTARKDKDYSGKGRDNSGKWEQERSGWA